MRSFISLNVLFVLTLQFSATATQVRADETVPAHIVYKRIHAERYLGVSQATQFYTSGKARKLFCFDFDENLTEVTDPEAALMIWQRAREVLGTGEMPTSQDWQAMSPEALDLIFPKVGTRKLAIFQTLEQALRKDQYLAITTNNMDPEMIRAFLRNYADEDLKSTIDKVPIIYRSNAFSKPMDAHGKNVHIQVAIDFFKTFGRITKIILADDSFHNTSRLEQSFSDGENLIEAVAANSKGGDGVGDDVKAVEILEKELSDLSSLVPVAPALSR